MSKLDSLRRLALDRIKEGRLRYSLILDGQSADAVTEARQALATAESRLAALTVDDTTYADGDVRLTAGPPKAVTDATKAVADAAAALAAAEDATEDATLVLVFRRLNTDEYNALLDKATDKEEGGLNVGVWIPSLIGTSFVGAEDIDAEPIDIDWDTLASATLSHGDMDTIGSAVVAYNRTTVATPFDRRNSVKTKSG